MAAPEVTDETTINDSHSVTVPAEVRDELDIEPGDKLRWIISEDGMLRVEVIRQRYGTFEELDPIDAGTTTNAVEETEDLAYGGE